MGKIYTDYGEYLQDAYEEQIDKYIKVNLSTLFARDHVRSIN